MEKRGFCVLPSEVECLSAEAAEVLKMGSWPLAEALPGLIESDGPKMFINPATPFLIFPPSNFDDLRDAAKAECTLYAQFSAKLADCKFGEWPRDPYQKVSDDFSFLRLPGAHPRKFCSGNSYHERP